VTPHRPDIALVSSHIMPASSRNKGNYPIFQLATGPPGISGHIRNNYEDEFKIEKNPNFICSLWRGGPAFDHSTCVDIVSRIPSKRCWTSYNPSAAFLQPCRHLISRYTAKARARNAVRSCWTTRTCCFNHGRTLLSLWRRLAV